jgi:tetratricopeptide (TPR) repeat protein
MIRFFILICFCWVFETKAQTPADTFALALTAQSQKNYPLAEKLYQSVLAQGLVSSELYNNLGLVYWEQQKKGKAVLYFEKAVFADPSNADAQNNLKVAQANIPDYVAALPLAFPANIWFGLAGLGSASFWGVFCILMLFGALGIWKQLPEKKNYLLACLGLWGIGMLFGFTQKHKETHTHKAVLQTAKVGLRQAPNLGASEIMNIYEGASGEIIETENDWVRLQLPDGTAGWLPMMLLERVAPPCHQPSHKASYEG